MLYTFVFMDKDFSLIGLFGLYGNLLTEHQQDLFNLYYECDLSLGEIAEIKGISRQSVNDGLKKAREILLDTESKLAFMRKLTSLQNCLTRAEAEASEQTARLIADIKTALEDN